MIFSIAVDTGKQGGVRDFSQSERQVKRPLQPTQFGTCLDGAEQTTVGALRRSIREGFPEEVTPKLRPEADVGVIWAMGRKAKASSEEPFTLERPLVFDPR